MHYSVEIVEGTKHRFNVEVMFVIYLLKKLIFYFIVCL